MHTHMRQNVNFKTELGEIMDLIIGFLSLWSLEAKLVFIKRGWVWLYSPGVLDKFL